ncbi:MAG: SCP2 sterol-binding domain-containing protein [Bradyrhizobium sp.]|nr:SCP2 sterol-binding domain-containing protein [Bradyrhizobium sp.]
MSVSLLLGRPLEFLPVGPVRWLAQRIIRGAMRQHPQVNARLPGLAGKRLLLDPSDLPFAFVLELTDSDPRIEVVAQDDDPKLPIDATVRGALADLISLAEGRVDGDALFFSRRLSVSGEMELIVAVRNAMDGAAIGLERLLLGPIGGPFRSLGFRALRRLAQGHTRLEADLALLAAAVTASLREELARQAVTLQRLQQEIGDERRAPRRARHREGPEVARR